MKSIHVAFVLSASILLGACATGKSKYQCPIPNGVSCKSVKQMYDITDASGEEGLSDARNALQGKAGEREQRKRGKAPRSSRDDDGVIENPTVAILDPGDPLPLRVEAKVLRVLITPWEDARGDLHAGGYVFTEIETRRWSMAPPAATSGRTAFPLQVEIAGMERVQSNRATAVSGANAATPGKETAGTPSAKPPERSSGGGGS